MGNGVFYVIITNNMKKMKSIAYVNEPNNAIRILRCDKDISTIAEDEIIQDLAISEETNQMPKFLKLTDFTPDPTTTTLDEYMNEKINLSNEYNNLLNNNLNQKKLITAINEFIISEQ